MRDAALIGIDWGSSSMRAMRISDGGAILDVRRAQDGVFTGTGDFAVRLRAHLGDWRARADEIPIVLCGMIGSDRGWVRSGYVAAPAGLDDLAQALTDAPFDGVARIVPGVSLSAGDSAEVMRGEETLVMGFVAHAGIGDARLCMPGTHSKWVSLRNGRIEAFRTYMTGELRALVLAGGALATDSAQTDSRDAFREGLKASGAALAQRLFQARARRLLGGLPPEHTAAFVSGVLIGEEIEAESRDTRPVFVLARDGLAADYRIALEEAGIAHTLVDPEPLAALGLWRIARAAGLLAG